MMTGLQWRGGSPSAKVANAVQLLTQPSRAQRLPLATDWMANQSLQVRSGPAGGAAPHGALASAPCGAQGPATIGRRTVALGQDAWGLLAVAGLMHSDFRAGELVEPHSTLSNGTPMTPPLATMCNLTPSHRSYPSRLQDQ